MRCYVGHCRYPSVCLALLLPVVLLSLPLLYVSVSFARGLIIRVLPSVARLGGRCRGPYAVLYPTRPSLYTSVHCQCQHGAPLACRLQPVMVVHFIWLPRVIPGFEQLPNRFERTMFRVYFQSQLDQ